MVEIRTNCTYQHRELSRALIAQIGVLVVSDVEKISLQTRLYFHLLRELKLQKLFVLVNKCDSVDALPVDRFEAFKERFRAFLHGCNYTREVTFIRISATRPLNVKTHVIQFVEPPFLGALTGSVQSKPQPLKEDQTKWHALDIIFDRMWHELLQVDVQLDSDKNNVELWGRRALCLYRTRVSIMENLLTHEALKEASWMLAGAFHAANKAEMLSKAGVKANVVVLLILGDHNFSKGHFETAYNYYLEVQGRSSTVPQFLASSLINVDARVKQYAEFRKMEKSFVYLHQLAISNASHTINGQSEEFIFSGVKDVLGTQFERSYIVCQEEEILKLMNFAYSGLANANVLTSTDFISAKIYQKSCALVVVEPVETLQHFFETKFITFLASKKSSVDALKLLSAEKLQCLMKSWWEDIAVSYKKILRGVVKGLIYIYQQGYACGNLSNRIFVTRDNTGKILPSMEKDKCKFEEDLSEFVAVMKGVLSQAAILENQISLDFLPQEVQHMLAFISTEKLRIAPPWMVIDHIASWEESESATFMRKWRKLVQSHYFDGRRVDRFVMNSLEVYFGAKRQDWIVKVPPVGLLRSVFDYGNDTNSHVKSYESNHDVIRFLNALLSHSNEDRYSSYHQHGRVLNDKATLQHVQAVYGYSIYLGLLDALYQHVSEMHSDPNSPNLWIWKYMSSSAPC